VFAQRPAVRPRVRQTGAREHRPLRLQRNDGNAGEADCGQLVADVLGVLADRPRELEPLRAVRNARREAPQLVAAVEDGDRRLAVRHDPVSHLAELGRLLTLTVKAQQDDVGNRDRLTRPLLELGARDRSSPTRNPRRVVEPATRPVDGSHFRRPVAFTERDRLPVAGRERFDQAALACSGAPEERDIERLERRRLARDDILELVSDGH
jgi:hypothetical protein